MSLPLLLLLLRIAAAALLYLFLLGVIVVIWRDWRATERIAALTRRERAQPLGHLVVVEGGDSGLLPGHAWPLEITTSLGRAPTNTVVIEDPFASSEHALIYRRDGRWWLEDLGSKNGTLLNGELLPAPTIVVTGDEVGIGSVRLRVELASMPRPGLQE